MNQSGPDSASLGAASVRVSLGCLREASSHQNSRFAAMDKAFLMQDLRPVCQWLKWKEYLQLKSQGHSFSWDHLPSAANLTLVLSTSKETELMGSDWWYAFIPDPLILYCICSINIYLYFEGNMWLLETWGKGFTFHNWEKKTFVKEQFVYNMYQQFVS